MNMSHTQLEKPDIVLDVVVVEDSPTQAQLLEHALTERGHEVRVARDGLEGIAALRERLPDLVISDIVMPKLDGLAMCAAIKADAALREVPVIMVTSLSGSEDILRALESNADGFILKPFDDEFLFSSIDRTLAQRGLRTDEFFVSGKRHNISADRSTILSLFSSVYDAVIRKNQELVDTQRELEVAVEEARLRGVALETANQELEAFTYSVSHDLRGPLRAIQGFSRILAQEQAERLDAEGLRLLRVVQEQTAKMAGIIDALLQLSRAGRAPLEAGPCDMGRLVETVVDELQRDDPDPTRVFDLGPLPHAVVDSSMIQQVWVNLLSNAVKFSARSRPPLIQVRGSAEGNEIIYRVTDNGAGFDMEHAGKLFGVFERLHSQEEYEGTGVGLSIVKRIVKRHGGRVGAEAQPGEGATFWFALPSVAGEDS